MVIGGLANKTSEEEESAPKEGTEGFLDRVGLS